MLFFNQMVALLFWVRFSTALTDEYKTRVLEELRKVCTREVYCRNVSTVPEYDYPAGYDSCCSECSCKDDCVYNCCFPTGNQRVPIDVKREQCMFLTSKKPRRSTEIYYRSYYVVTEPPQTGCVIDPGNNESSFKPWGSMHPVFSKKAAKIFYNSSLAVCYGDERSIKFIPYLSCYDHGKYVTPWGSTRFSWYLESMVNPEQYKTCHIEFIYPDNQEDIAPRQCYRNMIASCPGIPHGIHRTITMNTEEIESACTSGLSAPFIQNSLYANPFCAICNGKSVFKYDTFCVKTGNDKTDAFSSMLAVNKYISVIHNRQPLPKPKERVACKNLDATMIGCRQILCPAGHLKALNESCVWPFSNIRISNVFSLYDLSPTENITIQELRETVQSNTDGISHVIINPTPFMFTDGIVFYQKDPSHLIDHLHVRMELNNFDVQTKTLPELFGAVSRSLRQEWNVKLKTRTVQLIPALKGDSSTIQRITDINGTMLFEYLSFSDLLMTHIKGLRFQVDKMFLCEQIELEESEYTLIPDVKLIYHGNKAKNVFKLDEFVAIQDQNQLSVRICIEDSDFEVHLIGHSNMISACQTLIILVFTLTIQCTFA